MSVFQIARGGSTLHGRLTQTCKKDLGGILADSYTGFADVLYRPINALCFKTKD